MRNTAAFQYFADNHPDDPDFFENSLRRDKIESGIPLAGGALLQTIGENNCL